MGVEQMLKNHYVKLAILAVLAYLAYRYLVVREGIAELNPEAHTDKIHIKAPWGHW